LIRVNFINLTKKSIPNLKSLTRLANFFIKEEKLKKVEVSIIFITNQKMKEINNQYRKIAKTTDILSFSLNDEITKPFAFDLLGDIYISLGQAQRQALVNKTTLVKELNLLIIHGFLHLLGYNHDNLKNKKIMFKKQEAILNEFTIKERSKEKGF